MATASLADLRQPTESALPVVRASFFDLQGFELLQRVAKAFASSSLVPQAYQGNVANCMIALNLAQRLGADELMVMQNLYIVHGNPGWSSKFLIASVNTCGRYESLRYEWRGNPGAPDFGCRAWTVEKSTGHRLDGVWVDWKMVNAEGWASKSGSKWKTMPEQMFIYRAAAFWQRAYAPEISMGLTTAEELADVVNVDRAGGVTVTTELLRAGMRRVDADTGEIVGAESTTPSPAAAPAPAPAALPDNASPAAGWTPSPEEEAAIRQRELAEAAGDGQQQRRAEAEADARPLPSAGRRPRSAQTSME